MQRRATTPEQTVFVSASETRMLSTWLPLSVIVAALLGFETWLGQKGAYYALAVIPFAPVLLAALFVRRYASGSLTTFVLLLIPYLALQWAAEIYYLWHWVRFAADPAIPSLADYCWLGSYVFLMAGCWRAAKEHRGFRLRTRDAFIHGLWLATAAAILAWMIGAVIASNRTLREAIVMGLYPFLDAVVISLILIIRGRRRFETFRVFWTTLLSVTLAVQAGDVLWLLSKCGSTHGDALAKFGDAFFILADLLEIVALWVAFRLEPARASQEHAAVTGLRIKHALAAGGRNSLASMPIVIVLAAIVVAEQGVEHTVKPMLEGFTPMPFLIVSGLFALGLKGAFRKWEKRLEAVALYREEFRKRLRNGWDISEVETLFLDRLQDALQISSRDVRSIESGILIEQEEELRARLEMFQRNAIDERGAEEWQSTKSIWLSSIRDLSTQLTTFSTVHSTPGALVH